MGLKEENSNINKILEKAIQGDKAALEYLVSAYKNLAYTIAIRIVLNREDAEEVVQDSFLKAFASLGNFRKASKFSTWLYRIVCNTALTKLSKRPIPATDITDENEQGNIETEEWDLIRHAERKKYINAALGRLPPEDRLIISLHYIEELSISEICDILNMKKSAIKMRLLRGRKQLENELKVLLKNEVKDLL